MGRGACEISVPCWDTFLVWKTCRCHPGDSDNFSLDKAKIKNWRILQCLVGSMQCMSCRPESIMPA